MNHVKTYLAHLLTYLLGGATIVSKLDPTIVPPQLVPYVAGAALLVALGNHSYKTGAASAVMAAINASATPVKLAILAFILAPALTLMSGCATVQKAATAVESPQAAPIVQAVVIAAVATAEQQGVPAAAINSVAKQVLAADQGSAATLVTVNALVNQELGKLNLPPADLAAAQILEIALGGAIQARVGNDPAVAAVQVAIKDIATQVILATGG